MSLSVIIPVYNEEQSIAATLTELHAILTTTVGRAFELLVINDGSSDQTAARIEAASIPCQVFTHALNRGYGAAIKTGLRHAAYETVLITDADGTYPHQTIPALYARYCQRNLDMLVGARIGAQVTYPLLKKIPKFFLTRLANYITKMQIPDLNSGLRIFDKSIALQFFNLYPNGFSFTTTITVAMLCRGYEVEFTPIDYFPRQGRSKIAPISDTIGFFQLLCSMAMFFHPLKVFMPFVGLLAVLSSAFVYRDVFVARDLSQSSVLFPILTIVVFLIGLIADMISKK